MNWEFHSAYFQFIQYVAIVKTLKTVKLEAPCMVIANVERWLQDVTGSSIISHRHLPDPALELLESDWLCLKLGASPQCFHYFDGKMIFLAIGI